MPKSTFGRERSFTVVVKDGNHYAFRQSAGFEHSRAYFTPVRGPPDGRSKACAVLTPTSWYRQYSTTVAPHGAVHSPFLTLDMPVALPNWRRRFSVIPASPAQVPCQSTQQPASNSFSRRDDDRAGSPLCRDQVARGASRSVAHLVSRVFRRFACSDDGLVRRS